MEMFLDKQVRADSSSLQHTYANFASNLRDIVDVARASGARVLLSTVATNLKDCPPFASLHRQGLAPEALRQWTSLVQQGAAMESARSFEEVLKASAADRLTISMPSCSSASLAAFGRSEITPLRKSTSYVHKTWTHCAFAPTQISMTSFVPSNSSGKQVELLDAQSALAGESAYGVTGSELLYEHVHLTPPGNYILARAAFTQISRICRQPFAPRRSTLIRFPNLSANNCLLSPATIVPAWPPK